MTYKLAGEDVVRSSGVPYTVVRPCALTEEPEGAELVIEQGDNIKVCYSCVEVFPMQLVKLGVTKLVAIHWAVS